MLLFAHMATIDINRWLGKKIMVHEYKEYS